jgi:hypothetical protein
MDNLTQLFIRACKSANPKKRVRSVYRRFYNTYNENEQNEYDRYIAIILLDICDEHKLLSLKKLATELDPNHFLKSLYKEEETYLQEVIRICTSAIRLTEVKKLEGLTPPRKFRNNS